MERASWRFKDPSSFPAPPAFKGGSKKYANGATTGTEIHLPAVVPSKLII